MKLIDADLLEKKCKAVDDMSVKEFLSLLRHATEVIMYSKEDGHRVYQECTEAYPQHDKKELAKVFKERIEQLVREEYSIL